MALDRSATVRNFRLVAATAAMQLVTSMIRVISTLTDAQNTSQRQLEAEQKRKGNKVNPETEHLKRFAHRHRNEDTMSCRKVALVHGCSHNLLADRAPHALLHVLLCRTQRAECTIC